MIINHCRDAKSDEHGEHACAIFFMSYANFSIVETHCLFNVLREFVKKQSFYGQADRKS